MKNTTLISIALFFVLLISSLSFAQMDRPRFRDQMKRERGRMMQDMKMDKLNLSEEQKDAIEQLHFDHKSEMIDLHANLEKKQLELNELKARGNYTRKELVDKVKAISSAKEQIAVAKANHRMDIYELLNDEQRKTFDDFKGNFPGQRKGMREHMRMREKF